MKLEKGSEVIKKILRSDEKTLDFIGKYFWVMTVISILIALGYVLISLQFLFFGTVFSIGYILMLFVSLLPAIIFWILNFIIIVTLHLLVSIKIEVEENIN